MTRFNFLLLLVTISGVMCGIPDKPSKFPCKLDDSECLKEVVQWVVNKAAQGIPEIGVKRMDPMYIDNIKGHLGYVKYKIKNVNIEGIKTCKVNKVSVTRNAAFMKIDMNCRRNHMDGEYDVEGQLLGYTLKGKGFLNADSTNYQCSYGSNITFYRKHNIQHAKHENLTVKCDLLGQIDVNFRSLDGQDKLTQTALTLINLTKINPRLFSSLVDVPIHTASFNNFIKSVNSLLGLIPATELFQLEQ